MTDFFTEVANLATALVALATAIIGLSAAREQRPKRKRKVTADKGVTFFKQ